MDNIIDKVGSKIDYVNETMGKVIVYVDKLQAALGKTKERLDRAEQILSKCTIYSKEAQDFLKEKISDW